MLAQRRQGPARGTLQDDLWWDGNKWRKKDAARLGEDIGFKKM